MKYHKTIKVPIHYGITNLKLNKIDKLTAKITFCIWLYSDLLSVLHSLWGGFFSRSKKEIVTVLEEYRYDVMGATGLSSAYVQQCRDKALECWLSYVSLHDKWENKVEYYKNKKEKFAERYGYRLMKKEPNKPFRTLDKKISCRLDYRTCSRIVDDGNYIQYWANISSLHKQKTMLIP
ncbi:MAG: hypothetical protein ABIB71_02805, partial [Candidatus Woesearchaeota archaeon]